MRGSPRRRRQVQPRPRIGSDPVDTAAEPAKQAGPSRAILTTGSTIASFRSRSIGVPGRSAAATESRRAWC